MNDVLIEALLATAHSPLRNYAIPGLTSRLLGDIRPDGSRFRIFDMERNQHEAIAPHSHRYNFTAHVLKGWVKNIIWTPEGDQDQADAEEGDLYETTMIEYTGHPGCYRKRGLGMRNWVSCFRTYSAGRSYKMTSKEVHSIIFSRGARVLMEEGPQLTTESIMLEPVVAGFGKVPLGETLPWMFVKGASQT